MTFDLWDVALVILLLLGCGLPFMYELQPLNPVPGSERLARWKKRRARFWLLLIMWNATALALLCAKVQFYR